MDASTISDDMTSDEFPPRMGGELCMLISRKHPASLISSPDFQRYVKTLTEVSKSPKLVIRGRPHEGVNDSRCTGREGPYLHQVLESI